MGDNDDSSNAAHRAHETTDTQPGRGLLSRLRSWFGGTAQAEDTTAPQLVTRSLSPIDGMMNLRRMRVDDVSVPRADIVSVPDTITKAELVNVFRESGLTRLPVYTGTLDTPIGMAHLKDLALKHGFNGKSADFDLKQMLRPLLFVPPSMPIGVLLAKMQTERRHMALVIDEYGGVDGLVTIEDLIEQVIGEIEDEHDLDEGTNFSREKPGVYLAFARTPLEEFEAEIGLNLTDHDDIDGEEIDTLGGLVFMLAGHVPARGEVVPHPEGPEFEVIDADPRRIKRMRVRLKATAAGDAARARELAEAATAAARSA
ncbi:MAG: HlyC/CorC family transporter [Marivita sp.]|uniref:hemolysin family protein n=2 Tax=Marivita sp. TaxID=2003365 RepID=UPI001B2EA532|nr:hemolysin family protein [Marivita sp.]MBO6882446.1 HlyC/CorC family transporter [Marivita sp.]